MRMDAEVRDATLRVRTTVVPTDGPVPVSFGFHPYFALPGDARERWRIRLPVRRRIVLDARAIPTGVHEPVEPYEGRSATAATTTASTGSRTRRASRSRAAGGGSRSASRPAIRSRRCSPRPAAPSSASSR